MHVSRAARRYAEALHESAVTAGALEAFLRDLDTCSATMAGSRELRLIIASPAVSKEKKQAIIAAVFAGLFDAFTVQAFQFLLSKNREALLHEIIAEVQAIDRRARNLLMADIVTAEPLTDAQRLSLAERLGTMTQKTVELREQLNPAIIGGMVVRLDDMVYDGSIARKLERLRRRFIHGVS